MREIDFTYSGNKSELPVILKRSSRKSNSPVVAIDRNSNMAFILAQGVYFRYERSNGRSFYVTVGEPGSGEIYHQQIGDNFQDIQIESGKKEQL